MLTVPQDGLTRHSVHWDVQGMHVLQVARTLYKLDAKTISRASRMFEQMFSMPQNPGQEEGTEERPIFVPNIEEEEFDIFVAQSYSARFLIAEAAQKLAVHSIFFNRWTFHPAHLIQLGLEFNKRNLLQFGFKRVVELCFHELTVKHKRMMGPNVYQAMAEVKEVLDEHKRIVAAEPPAITSHSDNCPDHERCSQDWFAIWWNGMARYLLDGRNPLSYDEAFKRFENLQFGQMGAGCKAQMLDIVREGSGFRHAYSCVDDVSSRLAANMIRFESIPNTCL